MVKRCFVRINIDKKQYKVDRRDINHTHFIKKRITPEIPAFPTKLKYQQTDVEEDSEPLTLSDPHFNRYDSCDDLWTAIPHLKAASCQFKN